MLCPCRRSRSAHDSEDPDAPEDGNWDGEDVKPEEEENDEEADLQEEEEKPKIDAKPEAKEEVKDEGTQESFEQGPPDVKTEDSLVPKTEEDHDRWGTDALQGPKTHDSDVRSVLREVKLLPASLAERLGPCIAEHRPLSLNLESLASCLKPDLLLQEDTSSARVEQWLSLQLEGGAC